MHATPRTGVYNTRSARSTCARTTIAFSRPRDAYLVSFPMPVTPSVASGECRHALVARTLTSRWTEGLTDGLTDTLADRLRGWAGRGHSARSDTANSRARAPGRPGPRSAACLGGRRPWPDPGWLATLPYDWDESYSTPPCRSRRSSPTSRTSLAWPCLALPALPCCDTARGSRGSRGCRRSALG